MTKGGKDYKLEDDLMIKSRPKFGSKRYKRLEAAGGGGRAIWCERCKRLLFNPQSILIHQGNVCQGIISKQ